MAVTYTDDLFLESPDVPKEEKKVVLFVDDEKYIREMVQEILEQANYNVLLAKGMDEAINILATKKVDIMMSDKNMTVEGEGIQLFQKLSPLQKLRFILITSDVFPDQISAYRKEGILFVIGKPIQPLRIVEVIREAFAVTRTRVYVFENNAVQYVE